MTSPSPSIRATGGRAPATWLEAEERYEGLEFYSMPVMAVEALSSDALRTHVCGRQWDCATGVFPLSGKGMI
jgi:hypothetical protein